MIKSPQRRNGGWLDPLEHRALTLLCARTPAWMTPNRYTALGLAGAATALGGYALSARQPAWLFLASLGLVINWLGDSMDGSLARYRRIERPRFGYFLDNALDLVGQLIIAVGVGLSGFIRWDLCFLALSVMLMCGSLSLINTVTSGVHQLAYGRLGLTEMRLAGIGLNTVIFLVPPAPVQAGLALPMTYPNMLSLLWSLGTLVIFLVTLVGQARALAAEDPPRR